MNEMMKMLHDRYVTSRASDAAWKAVQKLYDADMITHDELSWFVEKCGSYIWDWEENAVYEMDELGNMKFARTYSFVKGQPQIA